jgi:ABC-type uncharacterized transport system substrate-binding protein
MIARRFAIFVAALGALWTPLSAAAEQARTVPRVGFLTPSPQSVREEVFWQELRRMGYVEGKTITVEYRSADGNLDRLPDLAKELVGLKMDIIVAVVTQASVAAKRATATIPIVMVSVGDPVGSGLVASLAHPGGNVTGTSSAAGGVVGKQLELLQELLPGVSRVTALWNPANPVFQQQALNEARSAAAKRHVQLHFVEARSPDDLDRAFATITKERTGALWIMPDPMLASQAGLIADFAVKHRLPAVTGGAQLCGSRRHSDVRAGFFGRLPSRCRIRRQDPQGGETGRPSGRTDREVRAAHQCQDGEGAGDHRTAVAHRACG